jgi:hypothetical protein
MRTLSIGIFGLVLGSVAAWLAFLLLFTLSIAALFPKILAPLAVLAISSYALARLGNKTSSLSAVAVAAPALIMSGTFAWQLLKESRSPTTWVIFASIAAAICAGFAWLGSRSTRPPSQAR